MIRMKSKMRNNKNKKTRNCLQQRILKNLV